MHSGHLESFAYVIHIVDAMIFPCYLVLPKFVYPSLQGESTMSWIHNYTDVEFFSESFLNIPYEIFFLDFASRLAMQS